MIRENLSWACAAMGGETLPLSSQNQFHGVCTDTRELQEGELFFCLMGERDGHDFARQALEKKAAGLVMDRAHRDLAVSLSAHAPCIVVPDTLHALGDLAHAWRKRFSMPIIALTGSNGKTTTKEMIRHLLATQGEVLATQGNLNNLIGVPKTLFRLNPQHQFGVIEMGMNDFGEIARLTEITQPTHGLITHIGHAHLEKLGGIEGVQRAKGELFLGMSPESTIFVNLLDARVASLPSPAHREPFGTPDSRLWGEVLPPDPAHPEQLLVKVQYAETSMELRLNFPGKHNLNNLLASLAVARHFHLSPEQIRLGLASMKPVPSRMQVHSPSPARWILDDCYNANPDSMEAALNTLSQLKGTQKSAAILGEMLELGDHAPESHRNLGRLAANAKVDLLIAVGAHAPEIISGAQAAGMLPAHLFAFADADEAQAKLQQLLPMDTGWILVKGSRGNRLEKIVTHLKEQA